MRPRTDPWGPTLGLPASVPRGNKRAGPHGGDRWTDVREEKSQSPARPRRRQEGRKEGRKETGAQARRGPGEQSRGPPSTTQAAGPQDVATTCGSGDRIASLPPAKKSRPGLGFYAVTSLPVSFLSRLLYGAAACGESSRSFLDSERVSPVDPSRVRSRKAPKGHALRPRLSSPAPLAPPTAPATASAVSPFSGACV